MTKTLIIAPLKKELEGFLAGLSDRGCTSHKSSCGGLPLYEVDGLGLLCSLGGHGKSQFAVQSTYLLNEFPQIEEVITIGVAGGIDHKLNLFDILAVEKIIEHDYKECFTPTQAPEYKLDSEMLSRLGAASRGFGMATVHFGRLASGDEDIVDKDRALELQQQTQALAVCWESAGAFKACRFARKPLMELRAISDFADSGAPGEFYRNLDRCMQNIAGLVLNYLKLN